MLTCTINSRPAYPSTADKIKVTYANQFIQDSGSYTYDISFPMSVHANQMLFGNIHRFDVHKRTAAFDDCKLYADNRLFISGKGTVTSVTESVVKLQIVGGKSRIKYNSNFERHFIDEVDFPDVIITAGLDTDRYAQLGIKQINASHLPSLIMVNLQRDKFVGQPGVAAFYPIYDETNECVSNDLRAAKFSKLTVGGVKYPTGKIAFMTSMAVQPNLLYVLNCILRSEGYTVRRNDFNVLPWTRLVIASARRTRRIREALPHWSVYTFIDEFRKLFNASFVFDDVAMTVDIISANELTANEAVCYDCLDEYTSEYDEDGLSNLATSNLEYKFDDSVNRDWREYIPLSVLRKYPTAAFDTTDAMTTAAQKMTAKERRQTIFKVNSDYYIWAMLPKDGNPDTEDMTEQRTLCGLFNPVMRDSDTDDSVELKIIPVAMAQRKRHDGKSLFNTVSDLLPNATVAMPSMSNDGDVSLDNVSQDDDGEYYISVQDAMQGAEDTATEEDDSSMIRLMFQGNMMRDIVKGGFTLGGGVFGSDDGLGLYPIALTDSRMFPALTGSAESVSLSLERLPHATVGAVDIDKHNLQCVRFVTDDIPDPSKIFIFRNRRFICQKVELEVSAEGVSRLKTGYFYEIL